MEKSQYLVNVCFGAPGSLMLLLYSEVYNVSFDAGQSESAVYVGVGAENVDVVVGLGDDDPFGDVEFELGWVSACMRNVSFFLHAYSDPPKPPYAAAGTP